SNRILVVSTDRATRVRTREALVKLGFCADCTSAAHKVVEHIHHRRPLAVLVDARLGDSTCADVVSDCRAELSRHDMPILVMAATPRAALEAIRAGAQGCVRAPVDASILKPMLTQVQVQVTTGRDSA